MKRTPITFESEPHEDGGRITFIPDAPLTLTRRSVLEFGEDGVFHVELTRWEFIVRRTKELASVLRRRLSI